MMIYCWKKGSVALQPLDRNITVELDWGRWTC